MQISVSELKAHAGKYVSMASEADVYITKNGKRIAKLTSPERDKITAAVALFKILPSEADLDAAKGGRL